MKCSVLYCPNTKQENKNFNAVNFHGFPTEKEAYNSWIAATGKAGFIPNLNSKICSRHFDTNAYDKESGRLKKNAVPTLMLGEEANTMERKEDEVQASYSIKEHHPYILNPSSRVDNEPSCNELIQRYSPQSTDTVAESYDHKLQNAINMQEMQLTSESVSTHTPLDLPGNSIIHPQITTLKNIDPQPSPCPIKLVDVKKLLENPPVENDETMPSIPYKTIENCSLKSNEQKLKGRRKNTPHRYLGNSLHTVEVNNSTDSCEVTVSHVLSCLRAILPRTFDLSRLNPNDKLADLVIKYLKLVGNEIVQKQIKDNLRIIIDAAKLEENTFGDEITHPYHKIKEVALSIALSRIFPNKFSVSEISTDKLKCLCLLLSQDVFVDGFNILRRRIIKHMYEEQNCAIVGNSGIIKNNTSAPDKFIAQLNTIDSVQIDKFDEQNSSSLENNKIGSIHKKQKINDITEMDKNIENNTKSTINYETHAKIISKSQSTEDKKSTLANNLKLIINFLSMKKYSAKFVLTKEKVLVNLCKYLHIRSRKSNLQKLKKMLLFIVQNNLRKNNMKTIEDTINRTMQENVAEKKQLAAKISQATRSLYRPPTLNREVRQNLIRKRNENKLKLRPVVVLRNIIDYTSGQLLFMGEERKYKPKLYHSVRVPPCFTQSNSLQQFSSDHVRKLTDESYREFRRIVMKKNGEKVVFRLHYKKLRPGSSVFVKNFMFSSSSWLKGTVTKMSGPLSYIVQLDDGKHWTCVPEQLRPLPEEYGAAISHRSQRNVKPKQLFDL